MAQSTFIGGDGIGISKDSKKAAQAWNFLAWPMSDEAQVEVLAKNKGVVARNDLVDNKYAADPRSSTINQLGRAESHTPVARELPAAFNAAGSPWVTLFRNAIFGDGTSVDADNEAITEPSASSRSPDRWQLPWSGGPRSGPPPADDASPPARRAPAAGHRPPAVPRQRLGWLYAAPTALFVAVFFVVPLRPGRARCRCRTGACSPATGVQRAGQLHRRPGPAAVLAGGRGSRSSTRSSPR